MIKLLPSPSAVLVSILPPKFSIGNEQFGIDIQYVENIVRMQRITRVPKAQNYFKGIINIRGEIIPVMSLRLTVVAFPAPIFPISRRTSNCKAFI